jgi:hypothetical protein
MISAWLAVTYKRMYRNEEKLTWHKSWLIENLNATSYLIIIAANKLPPNQFNFALLLGIIYSLSLFSLNVKYSLSISVLKAAWRVRLARTFLFAFSCLNYLSDPEEMLKLTSFRMSETEESPPLSSSDICMKLCSKLMAYSKLYPSYFTISCL